MREVSGRNWLEKRLATLSALYEKFGREGLKDQPIGDVGLLLSSKELEYRDAAKGRDLDETQKAGNRGLELEIRDLTSYLRGQVSGINVGEGRYRQGEVRREEEKQLFKERGGRQGR
jgi:hypothetical protein